MTNHSALTIHQIKVMEWQIDWPRANNVDEKVASAKIEHKRDAWYTGPDPYKGMKVLIECGSLKGHAGNILDSRVDLNGQWFVRVQWSFMTPAQPATLKISDVVEF